MGYTHYWRHTKAFTPRFLDGVKSILHAMPPRDGMAAVSKAGIAFEVYETFYFAPGQKFAFCKTDRQPGDVQVMAILALAAHLKIVREVSSDGDCNDWGRALVLAHDATGLQIDCPDGVRQPSDLIDI